MADVKLTP
jgi:hypothetical protein